jgi:hypothetical protein
LTDISARLWLTFLDCMIYSMIWIWLIFNLVFVVKKLADHVCLEVSICQHL